MITSYVITSAYPHLVYLSTDFDEYIINKVSPLSLLKNIKKEILDVKQIDSERMREFDVLLAWEVLYAFTEKDLRSLFSKMFKANTELIICTSQISGPLRYLGYSVKNILGLLRGQGYKYNADKLRTIRAHGFKYSLNKLQKIASREGLAVRLLAHGNCDVTSGDCYNFIVISKC